MNEAQPESRQNMEDNSQVVFIILLSAGLLMLGAEIFVPGGVLGVLGAAALIGAVVAAFNAFGPSGGALAAISILFLAGASIALWIRFFPRSRIGRRMTLATDESAFKSASDDLSALVGQSGTAQSTLRPSGYAQIGGKRFDVVSEGGSILKGEPLRVVQVQGNRIVVRKTGT